MENNIRLIAFVVILFSISMTNSLLRISQIKGPCKKIGSKSTLFMQERKVSDYRKLGDSDLLVSNVCLGSMTWGQQNTEDEGIAQLNMAVKDYGVNFIDTSEMYPVPTKAETQGATDKIIGKWLQSGIDRSKIILATKVAGASERLTWLPGREGKGSRVTYKEIIASVDYSLERLQTDYIDLLQIHWPDRYVALFGETKYEVNKERDYVSFEEQLYAMDYLIKQGKIRYFGVSNETPYGVMKFSSAAAAYGLPKIISIQNSYSLLTRSDFESGLIEVCSPRHENIGLLAYSPLAGGILTGKYADPSFTPINSRLNIFAGFMDRYKQSLAVAAVQEYCDIAKKYNMSPAQLSLLWCKSQSHVTSTIIGATTLVQLQENLEIFSNNEEKKITADILSDIEGVYKRFRDPSRI